MEIRKILFPVDLAGSSSKIVSRVLYMAQKFDAEVHLLSVAGSLEQYSTFYVPHPSLDRYEQEDTARAERLLREFAEEHFGDFPRLKISVLSGKPVEQIINYVDSAGIDMIMMTTHGRHGLERALFGSMAEEIMRSSSVPVMCFNHAVEEEKWKEAGLAAAVRTAAPEAHAGR
ncbi:MAG: universal stress protein [Syntrophobacteraceae bacterium]